MSGYFFIRHFYMDDNFCDDVDDETLEAFRNSWEHQKLYEKKIPEKER